MAAVIICSDFGAQENKVCHYFHYFPSICCEVMGLDAMIFVLWMLSFKPAFSLSSFTFIKRLFTSSAIRMVPSAYLRLLLLLPEIWEQWPHKRLTQTCLWVCRSLWWRRGLAVACRSVGGTECGSACIGPFEGGRHYLHYLHHSLVSGQTTGREHSPLLPIRTRSSFPLSQSLPSGTFHKPLILPYRGKTEWKPQSQKTNQ